MTIPTIATIEQLREHLKLPAPVGSPPVDDPDLQMKLDTATELVCEYIADKHPADPSWIAEIESWDANGSPGQAAPKVVVLAVLIQAGDFYRFRGDDAADDRPKRDPGYLVPSVEMLLSKYKNRAFA